MKTIDDFIKELQVISEDKRKLPLVIVAPNNELVSPSIHMYWKEYTSGKPPDKMIITY